MHRVVRQGPYGPSAVRREQARSVTRGGGARGASRRAGITPGMDTHAPGATRTSLCRAAFRPRLPGLDVEDGRVERRVPPRARAGHRARTHTHTAAKVHARRGHVRLADEPRQHHHRFLVSADLVEDLAGTLEAEPLAGRDVRAAGLVLRARSDDE